jgi:hypothetical protein
MTLASGSGTAIPAGLMKSPGALSIPTSSECSPWVEFRGRGNSTMYRSRTIFVNSLRVVSSDL